MLDRESLRNGAHLCHIRESERLGLIQPTSEAERLASRREVLATAPADDIWVFAYGSLIWNPAFEFVEQRTGRIHGYHRRYCILSRNGRGSPEQPGMMLGLDRGGSCHGVAYRIEPGKVEEELEILWSREMVARGYHARWVQVHTGKGPIHAIAFIVRRDFDRYCGRMDEAEMAQLIATGAGWLGTCAEYLHNTMQHLDALGLPDAQLRRLDKRVRALHAAAAKPAGE
jgi:glutathione-specific gamma-glutamylcyclotransferase